MAFTDYDVFAASGGTGSLVGGDDGSQQANAGLASPLVSQGTDCRRYEPANADANWRTLGYFIDDNVYTDFVNIPNTRAISVRAWIRKELENGAQNGGVHNSIALHAKGGGAVGASGEIDGVMVSFGRPAVASVWSSNGDYEDLNLRLRNGSNVFDVPSIVTNLARDAWHYVRLDVIPVLNGAVVDRDMIRVYTNTLANEADPDGVGLTLQHEAEVLLSELYAMPWGATSTRAGFAVSATGDAAASFRKSLWIDSFDARLVSRP